jgi:O-acetylhomoserine (thiol)-lyase
VIGGIVVDGGSFDWEKSGRFPELTQPYDGFHNMVFSEESTVGAPSAARAAKACATSAPA